MAMKNNYTAPRLIIKAIRETGTTDTGPVMLKMEDILHEEMMRRQPSYVKLSANGRMFRIVDRLERIGIYTYSDVTALIAQVQKSRAKEAPKRRRREEFRRALGM